MKIHSQHTWRSKMMHLELIEEVLYLAEKGTGSGPAEQSVEEKKITEKFLNYIENVKKAINLKADHFLRNKIKQRVIDKQGCKITELAAEIDLVEEAYNNNINFVNEIYDMIRDGELVEVEYVLKSLNYRIKSFILPADTEVRLGNEYELIRKLQDQIAEYKREQY